MENVPIGGVVLGANVNGAPTLSAFFDTVDAPGIADLASARVFALHPNQQLRDVVLTLPRPLSFGRLFVDILWPDGTPAAGGSRATADWKGRRSDFKPASTDGNRATLNLALDRTYDVSADWLYDKDERFIVVTTDGSQRVAFTRDGQIVTLRLQEKRPR